MADEDQQGVSDAEKRVREAQKDPNVPVIYFNGYGIRVGSDIGFVLIQNGVIVGIVDASHAVMKGFAKSLVEIIEGLEEDIGQKFLTADEIEKRMESEDNDSGE